MSKLADASAKLAQADNDLRALRTELRALRDSGEPPADFQAFLDGVDGKLRQISSSQVSEARSKLNALCAEDLAADAAAGIEELQGYIAAARQVARADVAEASDSVKKALDQLAKQVDVPEVQPIDKAALKQMITGFQADIEAREQWGDRISKIVASAVGIGKTAVKILT